MFTFRTNSPELTKAVADGLAAVAAQIKAGFDAVVEQLDISNQLKAEEILVQDELLELLRRQCRPARPRGLTHQLVRETAGMADILTYSVKCDAPTDPDVESRKLKVEVNGAVTKEETVGSAVTDFGTIDVEQDSQVKITIVDVDDANNESAPLVAEFQALDTIAPSAPTGMNVVLLSEKEGAAPTPPPEEPANPDPVTPADPVTPPAEEPPAPPAE